jgi:hypothetical protein
VVRAGLPILWLILNHIYKPAPTDVSVRYDGNTFFVFSKILSSSNAPYWTGECQEGNKGSSVFICVHLWTNSSCTQLTVISYRNFVCKRGKQVICVHLCSSVDKFILYPIYRKSAVTLPKSAWRKPL